MTMSQKGGTRFQIDQYIDFIVVMILILLYGVFLDIDPESDIPGSDSDRPLIPDQVNTSLQTYVGADFHMENCNDSISEPLPNISGENIYFENTNDNSELFEKNIGSNEQSKNNLSVPVVVGEISSQNGNRSNDIFAYLLMIAIPVVIYVLPRWMYEDRVMFPKVSSPDQESRGKTHAIDVMNWIGERDGQEVVGSKRDE
jgi:hypothetical protein